LPSSKDHHHHHHHHHHHQITKLSHSIKAPNIIYVQTITDGLQPAAANISWCKHQQLLQACSPWLLLIAACQLDTPILTPTKTLFSTLQRTPAAAGPPSHLPTAAMGGQNGIVDGTRQCTLWWHLL
jgi:hypothetical protein